jgi:hypothetical protein
MTATHKRFVQIAPGHYRCHLKDGTVIGEAILNPVPVSGYKWHAKLPSGVPGCYAHKSREWVFRILYDTVRGGMYALKPDGKPRHGGLVT